MAGGGAGRAVAMSVAGRRRMLSLSGKHPQDYAQHPLH